jgi:YD repeat-containing protein
MNTKPDTSIRRFQYGIILLGLLLVVLLGVGSSLTARARADMKPASEREYFASKTKTLANGESLDETIIDGSPAPPAGFEIQRTAVDLSGVQAMGIHTLAVPAYDWSFGCSATSGAMIAGYYDRNGFPNMYTGPTNGGLMPLDNSSWPDWYDGNAWYAQNPLAASHQGLDGRLTRGSMDDYWVLYFSSTQDPYITNSWTQHTWGDAIGDYMKTSQSAFNNVDGATTFYTWTNSATRLTCSEMVSAGVSQKDGTYGRKLFYEAKGYTVTDCYNQPTDNLIAGGFSYARYKAEIDAGRPVLLNLAGHTIVGVGYDDSSNTIYIHDTWDYLTHTMTWGGSYSGMALQSVSIVNLQSASLPYHIYLPLVMTQGSVDSPPGAFNKISPANNTTGWMADPILSWAASSNASSYEYCLDTSNDNACASWISAGASTSVGVSGLSPATSYYWQVRAINISGTTNASDGVWWTFTTAASFPLNGILNSDFESGSTSWQEYSLLGWQVILSNTGLPVPPYGGNYAVWLGGDDGEISYIQQQVTISSTAPYLVYWHWISSSDVCGYDFGGVMINGSAFDIYNLCSANNSGGWVTHSVDLRGYAGQSVTLQFRVETDLTGNSNLFIDDVSLQASAPALGPLDGLIPNPDAPPTPVKRDFLTQIQTPQAAAETRLLNPR